MPCSFLALCHSPSDAPCLSSYSSSSSPSSSSFPFLVCFSSLIIILHHPHCSFSLEFSSSACMFSFSSVPFTVAFSQISPPPSLVAFLFKASQQVLLLDAPRSHFLLQFLQTFFQLCYALQVVSFHSLSVSLSLSSASSLFLSSRCSIHIKTPHSHRSLVFR